MEKENCQAKKIFDECYAKERKEYLKEYAKAIHKISYEISKELEPGKLHQLWISKGKIEIGLLVQVIKELVKQNIECDDEELILKSSFSLWREMAFRLLSILLGEYPSELNSELLLYYVQKIDYELLPDFAVRIKTKYAQTVNVYNFGLGSDSLISLDAKKSKVYRKLIKVICKWLLNIELIVDMTERLKLYNLLEYKKEGIIQNCKGKWKPKNGITSKRIFKSCSWNMALSIHEKLSSTFYRLLKTFAVYNLPAGLTFGFSILKSLLAGTTFSSLILYPALGYSGVLTAGVLTSMLMKAGEVQIKSNKAVEDMYALISCFKETNAIIEDLLRQCNVLILSSLQETTIDGKDKFKGEINNILGMLFEKRKAVLANEEFSFEPLDGKHYMVEYLKSKDVEDDWVHISKINIEQAKVKEEEEGDLLKISVMEPDSK